MGVECDFSLVTPSLRTITTSCSLKQAVLPGCSLTPSGGWAGKQGGKRAPLQASSTALLASMPGLLQFFLWQSRCLCWRLEAHSWWFAGRSQPFCLHFLLLCTCSSFKRHSWILCCSSKADASAEPGSRLILHSSAVTSPFWEMLQSPAYRSCL